MPTWLADTIGVAAGVLGTICWLPQLYKTLKTRETGDLSLSSNLMLFTTILLWLSYGIALSAWPLIVSNLVAAVIIGTILMMKLRYG